MLDIIGSILFFAVFIAIVWLVLKLFAKGHRRLQYEKEKFMEKAQMNQQIREEEYKTYKEKMDSKRK